MDIGDSDKILESGNSNTWVRCCHLDVTSTKQAKKWFETHHTFSESTKRWAANRPRTKSMVRIGPLEAQRDEKSGFRIRESGTKAWRHLTAAMSAMNVIRRWLDAQILPMRVGNVKWQCHTR